MMPLLTTTIGAYPKPAYTPVSDWFQMHLGPDSVDPTADYERQLAAAGDQAEALFLRATEAAVADQVTAGVDVPTDGEIRRENYIHYHCRHLDGIDFGTLTAKALRGGAYTAKLPTVTGPIRARGHFLPRDYKAAQQFTDRPVKITVPGPMTIADTVFDGHYQDRRRLGAGSAPTWPTRSTPRYWRWPTPAAGGSRSTSRFSRVIWRRLWASGSSIWSAVSTAFRKP